MDKSPGLTIQSITELVENAGIFDSRGFSVVKVTKNGKENLLQLPIKSAGVSEYQADLSNKAPKPPIKKELITKNSPEGKALGLPRDSICFVFDLTDEDYVDALEKHNDNFAWRMAIFALDLTWKTSDGKTVEDFATKKKILQSNGITGNHLAKIYRDVEDLTKYSEEREDFLSQG